MYALADCNNFFVSCERAFQPELEGRPVVVLSNNDGCVVARSNESKAMGIKMGTPYYQVKNLVESGKLWVRSSNYNLYGDLSSRVMAIIADSVPDIEVYSIDECYMILDGMDMAKVPDICRGLVKKIRAWVGIPVSIGIAPTKTLAKVANHFAKRYAGYHGVCLMDSEEKRNKALALTEIGDVWGIGWRMAPKLKAVGITTAADFVARPESWVQKNMGIQGVRTWRELQGIESVLDDRHEKRQSICTSRSFAEMIDDIKELSLRVSDFAAKCAEKLRKEETAAYCVNVFLATSPFRNDLPQYYPKVTIKLPVAASSTAEIVGAALKALRLAYRPGYQYKRAGVTVYDIVEADEVEGTLFGFDDSLREKQDKLSEVMDKVNGKGKSLLRLATQRPGHYADGIRRDHLSRLYSTSWNDLLEVK